MLALTLVRGPGQLLVFFSDLLEIETVLQKIQTDLPEIETALPEIETTLPELQGIGCSELGKNTIFNEHPVVNCYRKDGIVY